MVRPMVHSEKHYVQYPIDQIALGTLQSIDIASGVAVPTASTHVKEGSSLKAIFFELWLQNQGALGEFIMTISKQQQNLTGPTFAEQAALHSYDGKKLILYTTQGLTSNDAISGPVNVIRGWIKIPKSKQRFGLGDRLTMNISNVSTDDLNRCGFSTYKEYT